MRKNNVKAWGVGIVIVVALVVLFAWPRFTNPQKNTISQWEDAGVDCLATGHANPSLHIHPELQIIIDGKEQHIPGNIGIVRGCMSELHTHEEPGVIHVESASSRKEFTLNQFFTVWGETIQKEGYTLEATADDVSVADPAGFILKDRQKIFLKYTKIPTPSTE